MDLPLEGIRILDFTQAIMGPLAAMMLGDMGAEVIKIERVQGEAQRSGRPSGMDEIVGMGGKILDDPTWMASNRSKKDLAINITHEKGREIILKLVKDADVFLQNWRPRAVERLQLGYDVVSKINPRIIYCWATGYGEKGPLANRIGGDIYSEAFGGVVDTLGDRDKPPYLLPFGMVDHVGGILIAYAIMLALFVKERTGKGQQVSINQIDTVMYMQASLLTEALIEGRRSYSKLGRSAPPFIPPWGPFHAKEGDVVTLFGSGTTWPGFCKVLGIEKLAHDPRFETDEVRKQHQEEMYNYLDQAFKKKTREEWAQAFRDAGMRCDPCLTYQEFLVHEQVKANEGVITLKHPARGDIKMLGVPAKLKATPGRPQGPPPLLGEHTQEILLKLGYTLKEIGALAEMGVIRIAE